MKRDCRDLMNKPSVTGGYIFSSVLDRTIKLGKMARWHMLRKPYSVGGAPLGEQK